MAAKESEELCAKLTGVVADLPADQFYNQFNLDGHSFSEYYFKDMLRIFHLPAMDNWPKTLNNAVGKNTKMHFSLICFLPMRNSQEGTRISNLVHTACTKVTEMFFDCFPSPEDHKCIHMAMDNYPTIAIFMSKVSSHQGQKKRARHNNDGKQKSILDDNSASCLAAVNYFRDGTNTQVLWLATT